MIISKLTLKTSDGIKTYENVRVVKLGTFDDVFGELVDAIQPEFEIICPDGKRIKVEFNSLIDIVL